MTVRNSEDRVKRWEHWSAAPLTALAAVFLALYAIPVLRPELSGGARQACATGSVAIWVLFVGDYVVRLGLAGDRRRFVRAHLLDLVVLVLPMFRQLRVVRLVTAVLVLNRRAEVWTRGRLAWYVGMTTTLLVATSGLAVLDAERANADSNITTYPDALWWSMVTITTVGYGDHYPTTATGRVVAVALMIAGIGLIGFVTGSLASWIVERISATERVQEATKSDVEAVLAELAALRTEVAALRAVGDPAAVGEPADAGVLVTQPAPRRR